MLALAARAILVDGAAGVPQDLSAGVQYYRMHPSLLQLAERKLGVTGV